MDEMTFSAGEASSAASILSTIPGLDAKSGLTRVSGNAELYVSLLRRFAAEQKGAVARIREALEKGDSRGGEIIAHTLKGFAGNIGATEVQKLARDVEYAIKESRPAEIVNASLEALSPALDGLVTSLEKRLPPPAARKTIPVDEAMLLAACAGLKALLKDDDACSAGFFDDNASLFASAFAERCDRIEDAIRAFDFETAIGELDAALADREMKDGGHGQ